MSNNNELLKKLGDFVQRRGRVDKDTDYVALAALYGGYYAFLAIMCVFIVPALPFIWALTGKWHNPYGIATEAFWYPLKACLKHPSQTPPPKTDKKHDANRKDP